MKIVEFLKRHRVTCFLAGEHHHARKGWVQLDCPRCHSKGKYRMGINLARPRASCWVCGRLDLAYILSMVTGRPFAEVCQFLASLTKGGSYGDLEPKRERQTVFPAGIKGLLPQHCRYLHDRGFKPKQLIDLWGIDGIGIASRLAWRIFIPIDSDGRTVNWTTRSIADNPELRYISAKDTECEVPRTELLYGEDYCRHTIVVHEGPTDVWTTGPGAVGTLGIGCSSHQIARIAQYPRRVICFDNEPDAQQRAGQICNQLEALPGETYNVVLSGKDAASSPKGEVQELRNTFLGEYQ